MPSDVVDSRKWQYAAFISYSRAVDSKLAPALARGLQSYAKPWYRRRALRVFRDDDSLSVNPNLWSSVRAGLDRSEFFVLLASPESARSTWVGREVEHWLANRSASNLLIVVTDGDIAWDHQNADFDREKTTCLPLALFGAFADEPRWTEFRETREQALSSGSPDFDNLVADLAATLRHVPKDEIHGQDRIQHRRTKQVVAATIAMLSTLLLVVAGLAVVADDRADDAGEQRRIAEDGQRAAIARQLEAQSRESVSRDPKTALRLALAAQSVHQDGESSANLRRALTATAFAGTFPGQSLGSRQGFFPDGTAVATGDREQVTIWDIGSAPVKQSSFAARGIPAVSPDGRTIVTRDTLPASLSAGKGEWAVWDVSDRLHPVRLGQAHSIDYSTNDAPVFSPDGSVLAMIDRSPKHNLVRLWDISDRAEPKLRGELATDAWSVAFAPNGRTLAVGQGLRRGFEADLAIELWDIAASSSPALLSQKTFTSGGSASSLEFSGDGRLLVAGGIGPQGDLNVSAVLIDVTDVRRPVQLGRPIPGQQSSLVTAALAPFASVLATSAGSDQAVVLWDISDRANPRVIETLSGHTSMVRWIAFARDGTRLVTGDDAAAYQWHLTGRTRPEVIASADSGTPDREVGESEGLALSPDGKTMITNSENYSFAIWDLETQGQPRKRAVVSSTPQLVLGRALTISPDGRIVAVGGGGPFTGTEVFLFDISDRAAPRLLSRILEKNMTRVLSLVFAPDGQTLVVGGAGGDGVLDLWDVQDSVNPANLALIADTGIGDSVLSVAISADGRLLGAGGGNRRSQPSSGSLGLWDLTERGRPRSVGPPLQSFNAPVNAVAFSPDGRTLATGDGDLLPNSGAVDGSVILWDISQPERVRRIGQPLAGHQGPVAAVAFGSDGLLATAGGRAMYDRHGRTLLWDISDLPRVHPVGHVFAGHRGTVGAVSFGAAGHLLVTGGLNGQGSPARTAVLWNMSSLTQLRAQSVERACAIAGGGLDEQEWVRYVPSLQFRHTC